MGDSGSVALGRVGRGGSGADPVSPFFLLPQHRHFSKAPQVILTCIPGMWILGPIRSPPCTEEERETQVKGLA